MQASSRLGIEHHELDWVVSKLHAVYWQRTNNVQRQASRVHANCIGVFFKVFLHVHWPDTSGVTWWW